MRVDAKRHILYGFPMTFKILTYRWPSVAALARDGGVTHHAVRQWRARTTIPADRWPSLIAGAKLRGIELSYNDFVAALAATHSPETDHIPHPHSPLKSRPKDSLPASSRPAPHYKPLY